MAVQRGNTDVVAVYETLFLAMMDIIPDLQPNFAQLVMEIICGQPETGTPAALEEAIEKNHHAAIKAFTHLLLRFIEQYSLKDLKTMLRKLNQLEARMSKKKVASPQTIQEVDNLKFVIKKHENRKMEMV